MYRISKAGISLLILCFLWTETSVAQTDTTGTAREGVRYGFIPILSFNTDDGFLLGGEVQRYNYSGMKPFTSYSKLTANYKTSGAYAFKLYRDQVKTFGTDVRTHYDLLLTQNFDNYFLGKTDRAGFDKERFDTTSWYSFKSFTINIGGTTRFPLELGEGISRTDIKTGLRVVYETPVENPADNYINTRQPTGYSGEVLTLIDLAFVRENRDSEFRPLEGYYLDIGFKYAPPLISSKHVIRNYINAIGFVPVSRKIPVTLAARFDFQNTVGDTPYWFKPALGGLQDLRGYMFRRFSSDNSISYNLELRSWLISIPFKEIQLGLNLFADGGRVFSNSNWGNIFNNHNHTLGFGGVMSIFTPDYILKYDIGFSEDGVGIYLGTGYSF